MPELIDREVTQLLLDTAIKQFGENWLQDKLTKNGLLIAKQIISKQPTVESEPVRHGRWINDELNGKYNCTCCNKGVWRAFGVFDFCPNCGARMDGGCRQ
jgi:hypothetical protein